MAQILRRREFMMAAAGAVAIPDRNMPNGYDLVWSDDFNSLSLRTGGPTWNGLSNGSGTWAAPGATYSDDPRGNEGYGYEWLINPFWNRWPADYSRTGQLAITPEGLRIRAQVAPAAIAALLPKVRGRTPWISGQVNSWHSVRISPPFYFEANAKMPRGIGQPFPAIWLISEAKVPPRFLGKEYEIDVHEGFGDSDKLHSTLHWNTRPDGNATTDYPSIKIADTPTTDLSTSFNTWGCHVTAEQQIVTFNGHEIGRVTTPKTANVDQPYGIILDVCAGISWDKKFPEGGPHDMIVRYVKLYAPNTHGLILRR